MTAPVYDDKDRVEGLLLSSLISQSEEDLIEKDTLSHADSAHNTRVRLARTARALWRERDKARETAALQDAGIQAAQAKMWLLEKMFMAVEACMETGYMPKFTALEKAVEAYKKFKATQ